MKYPSIPNVFPQISPKDRLRNPNRKTEPWFDSIHDWIAYEKIDGTNTRIIIGANDPGYSIRGRTDSAQWNPVVLSDLKEIVDPVILPLIDEQHERGGDAQMILYGEAVGPKVQQSGAYFGDGKHHLVLFDIAVTSNGRNWHWLERDDVNGIAGALAIPIAPSLGIFSIETCISHRDTLRHSELARRNSGLDIASEGVVIRPLVNLFDAHGARIIGKIRWADLP